MTAPVSHRVPLTALPGWAEDDVRPAFVAFRASCKGTFCAAANRVDAGSDDAVRAFLTAHFEAEKLGDAGLLTGYHEQWLKGSRVPSPDYPVPLYRMPPHWKGKGPFDDRRTIEQGSLAGQGLEIAWLQDPIDAFFLHVQGSGRIHLPDGSTMQVGFAGRNGHPYHSVGATMVKAGMITREEASALAIKDWLRAHPERIHEVLWTNPSYIFFEERKGSGGPVGAAKVALTPGRSVAVDADHTPLGSLLWLVSDTPKTPHYSAHPLQRLVVAQDTGSAIKGAVRADFFYGSSPEAEELASFTKQPLTLYRLLPRK
jgi:membrane-bound lytic murein transglycosylase A